MVTLSDNELKMLGRKSSKGNQLKFEKATFTNEKTLARI